MKSETRQHSRRIPWLGAGLRSLFRPGLVAALAVGVGAALSAGCLERPICGDCKPGTSNVIVKKVPINNIAKIDLLFVIDNSASMADKQQVMKQAVPAMLNRLVTPNCVQKDADGNVVESVPGIRVGNEVNCPRADLSLEFQPINDIHIAVITSSLGSHGFDPTKPASCDNAATPQKNDRARPIPLVRPNDPSVAGKAPFLTWTGGSAEQAATLGTDFGDYVGAAGEVGCGLEAPNEAWYRFLVDPEPPASMSMDAQGRRSVRGPVDTELLDLRKSFLRPDSLVAIVVLTDENDCSAMDGGKYYAFAEFGHLVGNTADRAFEATDICAENPNDICCQTCRESRANPGCDAQFAKCAAQPLLPPEQDRNNLRCFDNQRRFGFDLLYPISRYVEGLTQSQVRGADGDLLPNSLVSGRDPGLIFFAGITGVPWQDLATEDTLNDPDKLKYLTARQLKENVVVNGEDLGFTYWDLILGEPGKHVESRYCREKAIGENEFSDPACGAKPVLPRDPFMVESMVPRTGRADITSKTNPRVNVSLTDSPAWNPINGHEYQTDKLSITNNDLQYSCIFPLGPFNAEKDAATCAADTASCDCGPDDANADKPLCKKAAGGALDGGQYWGKAYPSTRTLEIMKAFGENTIAASICPKVTDASNKDYYGYTPAVSAIIDRLAEKLGGQCLPRPLVANEETGEVPCVVVEARAKTAESDLPDLDCSLSGREPTTEKVKKAVLDELEKAGNCYFESTPLEQQRGPYPCSAMQMCSINQLTQDTPEGQYCLNDPGADSGSPGGAGYCYIDEKQGNAQLLSECPTNEKRKLRFVFPQSAPTPQNNTTLFYACVGEAATGR